ncbi:MAG: hypothetical protein H7174_07810 [Flavobacterium sp.]|nr:hypothetical protein [Flavobacterium sp.]
MKIPILVEHFNEHKQENPKLSLWAFIMDHYSHGEVIDADFEKDMKLPFKSHNSNCSCSIITFLSPIQTFDFEQKSFTNEFKKPCFGYKFSFISNFHSAIWQPPKIC